MSRFTRLVRRTKSRLLAAISSRCGRCSEDGLDRFAETTQHGAASIYAQGAPVDCSSLNFPGSKFDNGSTRLTSCLCTREQMDAPAFHYWANRMRTRWRLHRKIWEHCYILQALYERDMLREGRRGLGFALGNEPLPSLMASMGCTVLASDLDAADDRSDQWAQTGQLAASLEALNQHRLCDEELFKQRVSFRPIDMNRIPAEVRDFDFTWSSCSFEHCGSIELGKRFIQEQMECLKPGGVAVHTTEYNLSSLDETIEEGTTVLFRRQDIEAIIRDLQANGHDVEPLHLGAGVTPEDSHISLFPYSDNVHLKLELFDKYVSTSIALIIRKAEASAVEMEKRPAA